MGSNEFNQAGPSIKLTPKPPLVIRTDINSSSTGCLSKWECTEWSACDSGYQVRTCSKAIRYCTASGPRPIESQTCTVPLTNLNNPSGTYKDPIQLKTDASTTSSSAGGLPSAITGAVVSVVDSINSS